MGNSMLVHKPDCKGKQLLSLGNTEVLRKCGPPVVVLSGTSILGRETGTRCGVLHTRLM